MANTNEAVPADVASRCTIKQAEKSTTKSKSVPAKDRMRAYRERLKCDVSKYEEMKEKDRKRKRNAYKPVSQMSERQHRHTKKQWRLARRQTRGKKKTCTMNFVEKSPQFTPASGKEHGLTTPASGKEHGLTRQKLQSVQKKLREREHLLKQVKELQQLIRKEKAVKEMYKKRCERLEKRQSIKTFPDTPRKRTQEMLTKLSIQGTAKCTSLRRTLKYHFALLKQLKTLRRQHKKTLGAVCRGEILRKYKLTYTFRKDIGFFGQQQEVRLRIVNSFAQKIKDFFLRVDVSKIVAGKKNIERKGKIVKQRRILTDTLYNLFLKFNAEQDGPSVSFTTFWRFKPFWVRQPKDSDRNTCQCKHCENCAFTAEAVYKLGAVQTGCVNVLVHQSVCDVESKSCMFGTCSSCVHKQLPKIFHVDPQKRCVWKQWVTVKEERVLKNGSKKKVTLTQKVEQSGTFADLENLFQVNLKAFKKHLFIMKNQFKHYSQVKHNLSKEEVLIHIDFAQNYIGKYSHQLQSVHYGASQPQISLHTGFYKTSTGYQSFCGVSDSLDHCPESIWAYLGPVLDDIKAKYPSVNTVHFFSDGPTQQYRQKKNFFLFSTYIFNKGFVRGFWNFFAAGHGKGTPDGIGAAVKRHADLRVKFGADIMNAKDFISEVSETGSKVMLYEITKESFKEVDKTLQAVRNTMSIHQVLCFKKRTILHRELSCTCLDYLEHSTHEGHALSVHKFGDTEIAGTTAYGNQIERSPVHTEHEVEPDETSLASYAASKMPLSVASDINSTSLHLGQKSAPHINFSSIFSMLSKCRSFSELQNECESIFLKDLYGSRRSVIGTRMPLDLVAKKYVPQDLKTSNQYFPTKVRADGNCLPACGAVFAFGADVNAEIIRLHIIKELVSAQDYYLQEKNLLRGFDQPSEDNELSKAYAQYSEHFIPGKQLNADTIKFIYETEVMDICHDKTYMGIWQMHALASVLKMPILSVYPNLGNPVVRKHLHRKILPRIQVSEHEAIIMWSSTRADMTPLYWVPNHFVPLLPFSA